MTQETVQKQWYAQCYGAAGADRNDLRTNPGVRLQVLAQELSFLRAFSQAEIDPAASRLLDVGCGSGVGLFQFIRMGFLPANISGIDIQQERIAHAREIYPHAELIHGDATALDFADSEFDLVSESTLFVTLTSDSLRQSIAAEMVRVCRPGGYLMLVDWRMPRPGNPNFKALTRREVRKLFGVDERTALLTVSRGALVPPLGRFFSRWLPSLYFLVSALCPALVGQVVYLLRKNS